MTIIIQSLIGRNAEFLVFPHVIPKTKNLVLYDLDNNNNRKLLSKIIFRKYIERISSCKTIFNVRDFSVSVSVLIFKVAY